MPIYRERLFPSPWVFVSTALVMPAALLVFLPINIYVGIAVAIGLYAAIVVLAIVTTPTVEVTAEELIAGRAHLPRSVIGEVVGYEAEEATLQRGRLLDARAWLLIRGWISPIVRVELTDPDDPTPYWIVSTRRPAELVAALRG